MISRVTRTKQQAQTSYDRLSRWYDIIAASEKNYREIGLRALNAQHGERILEIGFGTGQAIVALAQAVGEGGRVYGMDISPGMLVVAQKRVDKAGLTDRVKLVICDAAEIPCLDDDFDAVFISFTLELFDTPEISVVLAECKRVLVGGGRLCVVSMNKGVDTLPTRLYEWAHRTFPNYADCRPIYARQSLQDAGFIIQKEETFSMWGLPGAVVVGTP